MTSWLRARLFSICWDIGDKFMWWAMALDDHDGPRAVRRPDWVEDESMSAEETLARFDSLRPEPAKGWATMFYTWDSEKGFVQSSGAVNSGTV